MQLTQLKYIVEVPLLAKPVVAALLLIALSAPAGAAHLTTTVAIPDDTVIAVQLLEEITSSENHIGDDFDVRVVDAINAGGYMVVASNAKGRGHLTKVDQAGGHGHAGVVEVAIDYVYAVDGEKIRLKEERPSPEFLPMAWLQTR